MKVLRINFHTTYGKLDYLFLSYYNKSCSVLLPATLACIHIYFTINRSDSKLSVCTDLVNLISRSQNNTDYEVKALLCLRFFYIFYNSRQYYL